MEDIKIHREKNIYFNCRKIQQFYTRDSDGFSPDELAP